MSLIVFEGIDGSGKSTQFKLLCDYMTRTEKPYTRVVFPQYDKASSALLTMYLSGEFGKDPNAVSPYAASTFYAVDRYASFKQVWGEDYRAGATILADRYTTSNAVHQGAKFEGEAREKFFRWLDEFEHDLMELPRPDIVLYMDVPLEIAMANMKKRQTETGKSADIHETGEPYLKRCRETARAAAALYGWHIVHCAKDGKMRDEDDIHQEIVNILF